MCWNISFPRMSFDQLPINLIAFRVSPRSLNVQCIFRMTVSWVLWILAVGHATDVKNIQDSSVGFCFLKHFLRGPHLFLLSVHTSVWIISFSCFTSACLLIARNICGETSGPFECKNRCKLSNRNPCLEMAAITLALLHVSQSPSLPGDPTQRRTWLSSFEKHHLWSPLSSFGEPFSFTPLPDLGTNSPCFRSPQFLSVYFIATDGQTLYVCCLKTHSNPLGNYFHLLQNLQSQNDFV